MAVYPLPGFYEPVNAILHLGASVVFAGLAVRLVIHNRGSRLRLALLGVFAVACVFMLAISGVYHMLTGETMGRAVLLRIDKAAIYVLIAGTFTPVHGLIFRGALRWIGIVFMWIAAATGISLTTVFHDEMPRGLGTTLYIVLGWMAGMSVLVLWRRRGFYYIQHMLYGGIAYSVGAILLGINWPTIIPGVFGPHEFWHIAVITGICLHWQFVAKLARDDRRE